MTNGVGLIEDRAHTCPRAADRGVYATAGGSLCGPLFPEGWRYIPPTTSRNAKAVAVLLRAIRETAAGGIVMSPAVSIAMLDLTVNRKQPKGGIADQLTDRELQVFRLAGMAHSTRVVAEKLGVSVKTVETHRENIKNKLDLHSHAELVARAAQWLRESEGP